ncbi:MAG: hypothetical protein M1819_006321 [Sarea resinae]|nr:MAG: hypothetical protein M1819_006321 [Sarea resinae]
MATPIPSALITGGCGFVGRAIVQRLTTTHPETSITVLDLRAPSTDAAIPGVDHISADITSASRMTDILQAVHPTLVIHTAGIVPAGSSRYAPTSAEREAVKRVNIEGTRTTLRAAQAAGATAFVYTSSCTVVTDDVRTALPHMTEALPTGFATLVYGASKAAAEALVLAASSRPAPGSGGGFSTCALRPSMVFGPGDTQVLPPIHACIAAAQTPFVLGDGENLYDFTHVENVAHAHVLAAENLLRHANDRASGRGKAVSAAAGEAFFISNAEPVPFRDFCLAVWAEFGHVPPYTVYIPASVAWWAGYAAEWLMRGATWLTGTKKTAALSRGAVEDACGVRYACIEKARATLGYVPIIGLVEGLRESCREYKERLKTAEGKRG